MPTPVSRSVPLPPINEQLIAQVAHIFQEAQKSSANHNKNFVSLHKAHLIFSRHRELTHDSSSLKLTGERHFHKVVQGFLIKVFPLKKGEVSADRILKFLGGYLKFINEKVSEQNDDDDDFDGTPRRFTSFLVKFLSQGFGAKDKSVRYRVLQTIEAIAPNLGEVSEEVFNDLWSGTIGRISDKESSVRVQAILSLIKLRIGLLDEDAEALRWLEVLIETLASDPSAEVRRSALCNLPVTNTTLSAILRSTRDTDTTIRKLVYSQVLANAITTRHSQPDVHVPGPAHPNNLTEAQREMVIRNGLGDRESSVKAAASTLISDWVDAIDLMVEEGDVKEQDRVQQTWDAKVLLLLSLLDLGAGTGAMDALFSLFTSKPEMFNKITFQDDYWRSLTPEKAFFARVFVEHCKNKKDDTSLDRALPDVVTVAFLIQETFNALLDDEVDLNEDRDDNDRRQSPNEIITVSELLRLAVHLDYSDEIGRRKTLALITELLKNESLPHCLVPCCLDVLRALYPKEQDLIKLIVEIIHDLCDAVCDDDVQDGVINSNEESEIEEPVAMPPSARLHQGNTAERKSQIERVEFKCLNLCIKMLERVDSPFERNLTLSGIVDELILPAITKSKNPMIIEMGFKAYGLCSLIAKDKATPMIQMMMKKISTVFGALKSTMLESLFDALMVHENFVFKDDESLTLEAVTNFLLSEIRTEKEPQIRALLCHGTAKLVLSGMITTIEAIQTLLKTYFSPITTDNHKLRQCLTMFFQIYSHSSGVNQKRMADIFVQVYLDISEDRKELEECDEDMEIIGSAQVADMFLEWTDPVRLLNAIDARGGKDVITVDDSIQLSMAESIILLLFGKGLTYTLEKEDKKILCQLLNKLYVPDIVDDYKIRSLKLLMDTLSIRRPLRDAVCLNAFNKFESSISKKFAKQLEGFSEEEFRKLEELTELFDFLDSIIPLDDDELEEYEPKRKGKKRRSTSRISRSRSGSPYPQTRNQTKRPRLSKPDDDEDPEDDRASPIPVPPKALPKRASTSRKPSEVIVISSDSDEDTREPKVKINRKINPRAQFRPTVKTEDALVDRELLSGTSSLTLGEVSYDSIMDDSIIPDSEEEVNDLLAEFE